MEESELFRRYAQRIRRYGLRHLRDAALADDLVQQVLMVTLESLRAGRVRELDRLPSFVLGVCRLVVRGSRQTDARRRHLLHGYLTVDHVEPDPITALDLARLRRQIEALPPRERAVMSATLDDEPPAGDLRMTHGHVRVVRCRAVRRLQAALC